MPSILSEHDLPWAELQALRLDGDVWSLGTAMAPFDIPSTVELRAASLRPVLGDRMVAELETAAWVWGASTHPPYRPQACVRADARTSRDPSSPAIVREVVIGADSIAMIGGVSVCTPLHTAIELARAITEWMPAHATIVANLAETGRFTIADVVGAMDRRRNLPNKRRAVHRLTAAMGGQVSPS